MAGSNERIIVDLLKEYANDQYILRSRVIRRVFFTLPGKGHRTKDYFSDFKRDEFFHYSVYN